MVDTCTAAIPDTPVHPATERIVQALDRLRLRGRGVRFAGIGGRDLDAGTITGCHVVARGGSVTLINGNTTLKAEIIAADLAKIMLAPHRWRTVPVPGSREADSLMVGETVYTIGSPKGLVDTWVSASYPVSGPPRTPPSTSR